MTRYLFDTDTCIYLINRARGYERLLARLEGLPRMGTLVSAVTVAELEYGAQKSARRDHNRLRLAHFIARFELAHFDQPAAEEYGRVRADLERRGTPIGPLDTMIAAQARALGTVLISHNTREFSRVSGLKVRDWIAE